MRNVFARATSIASSLAALATLAIATTIAPPVRADDPPKRAIPDYDGRPDPAPSAGDDALWSVHVILLPLYLVSEFLLRRPLGALITTAERNNWATTLQDIFTFGPEHKAGVVPTAFFDFGLRPSVGVYFFWDDVGFTGNGLRAHVSYFGSDWLAISATDRVVLDKRSVVALDVAWLRRPDFVYAGEGPRTLQTAQSRYLSDRFDVTPSFDTHLTKSLSYQAKAGLRVATFKDAGAFDGDPSVQQSVAAGTFALPNDYVSGYTAMYERSELVLDTRRGDNSKSGVRVRAGVEHGTDVQARPASSWIKYGATAGGFLDIWKARVVSLSGAVELVDPVEGGAGGIPFTELVTWGGLEPMSGYLPGRLHGRSATSLSFGYSWPIWVWLDGTIRASVGNVFDAGLKDFDTKLFRLTSGIGIQSNGSPDHRLEIIAGFGTETFDQGAKIDSFRLAIGGTNGF